MIVFLPIISVEKKEYMKDNVGMESFCASRGINFSQDVWQMFASKVCHCEEFWERDLDRAEKQVPGRLSEGIMWEHA